MQTLALSGKDKSEYIKMVGQSLVSEHGIQKFYSPKQVETASKKVSITQTKFRDIDWHCWAMCIYCPALDFSAYHAAIGENCDYESMKSEMTSLLTEGDPSSWFDIDLSWLEWPDLV